MKEFIKIWGIRIIILALLFVAGRKWGVPLYKQYFTQEKAVEFIPTSTVRQGAFTVSFHEIGALEAVKTVPVMNMVDGKIIKLVNNGIMVQTGDLLCELDTSDMENDVRNAKLTYKNALSDVDRAKSDLGILKESDLTQVKQAEEELKFAQTELEQSKIQLDTKSSLLTEKLVTKDSVTALKVDFRSKQLAVTKQELALTLLKDKVISDERQKEKDVEKMQFAADIQKNALDDIEKRISHAIIKAPASGLVVLGETYDGVSGSRKLQEGDQARRRQMICNIPDLTSMRVKVKLGESDAPKVQLGLAVLIRMDAVPNKVFHGVIQDIASLARADNPWEGGTGRKQIEIVIAVKESDPRVLKPGMSADVEFICKQIKKAVFVPIEAVSEKDGKTGVYVKAGKSYRRVQVTTGLENDSFVCISKGVTKGQVIALRDPTKPVDSQVTAGDQQKGKEKKESAPPLPTAGKK